MRATAPTMASGPPPLKKTFKNEEERINFAEQTKFMAHFKVTMHRGATPAAPTSGAGGRKGSRASTSSELTSAAVERFKELSESTDEEPTEPTTSRKRARDLVETPTLVSAPPLLPVAPNGILIPANILSTPFTPPLYPYGIHLSALAPLFHPPHPVDDSGFFPLQTEIATPPDLPRPEVLQLLPAKRSKTEEITDAAFALTHLVQPTDEDDPPN